MCAYLCVWAEAVCSGNGVGRSSFPSGPFLDVVPVGDASDPVRKGAEFGDVDGQDDSQEPVDLRVRRFRGVSWVCGRASLLSQPVFGEGLVCVRVSQPLFGESLVEGVSHIVREVAHVGSGDCLDVQSSLVDVVVAPQGAEFPLPDAHVLLPGFGVARAFHQQVRHRVLVSRSVARHAVSVLLQVRCTGACSGPH
jgi:hypothetical protein